MTHADFQGLPSPCTVIVVLVLLRAPGNITGPGSGLLGQRVRHVFLCFQPPVLSSLLGCSGKALPLFPFWPLIPSCHRNRMTLQPTEPWARLGQGYLNIPRRIGVDTGGGGKRVDTGTEAQV